MSSSSGPIRQLLLHVLFSYTDIRTGQLVLVAPFEVIAMVSQQPHFTSGSPAGISVGQWHVRFLLLTSLQIAFNPQGVSVQVVITAGEAVVSSGEAVVSLGMTVVAPAAAVVSALEVVVSAEGAVVSSGAAVVSSG